MRLGLPAEAMDVCAFHAGQERSGILGVMLRTIKIKINKEWMF
jgi:hypothetical protein